MAWRIPPTLFARQFAHLVCDAPFQISSSWRVTSTCRPHQSLSLRGFPFSSSCRNQQAILTAVSQAATPNAKTETRSDSAAVEATRSQPSGSSKRSNRKKGASTTKAPLAKIAKDAEVSHLHGLVHGSPRGRDPKVKVSYQPTLPMVALMVLSASSRPVLPKNTTLVLLKSSCRRMAFK